ncbi:hypothetical protein [Sphingopyxis indica]|uniref:Uncharacterized protein n=1 Tax=Sphingopyxis indica TaxID=436663 RepID=A0A239KMR9_9SPHN|nr:hypothetical protein [Sphingopyxis indica]SNT19461.1 hypothetical protein SAMN06295955_11555 [Sphingopyxis indica]
MATASLSTPPDVCNEAAWNTLMSLYLSAKAAADEYERKKLKPLSDERGRIWPDIIAKCDHEMAAQVRWDNQSGYGEVVDEFQALIDIMCEREDALIGFPAPNLPALSWKLEKILEPNHDSTPCWNMSYVRQTIEDHRRLLNGTEA